MERLKSAALSMDRVVVVVPAQERSEQWMRLRDWL